MKQIIFRFEIYFFHIFFHISSEWMQFHDLHFSYRIGFSTASETVIWSIIRPECIPNPTKEQWKLTTLEFEKRVNLLHYLGARRWETYSSNRTGTQWLDAL
jgi:hypothetical protein